MAIFCSEVAACRGMSPVMFYGHEGERPRDREAREKVAKAFCGRCPAVSLCLWHALENDQRYGIWGGLGPEERAELLAGSGGVS